jgi:DNA-binding LacI/PurR family transcriptional regulator
MLMKAKDLAREIGVSEATVSLVINGNPGISQKTREMVESKIIEMGYGSMLRQESPSPSSQGKVISFILYKENGELLEFGGTLARIRNNHDRKLEEIIDRHCFKQLDEFRKTHQ